MSARLLDGRFFARPPWWGGDLQTLRNSIVGRPASLRAYPAERLEFALPDGSGDRLVGTLNRPLAETRRPLVILLHGMAGSELSLHMLASARHFLGLGYPVLRLNLRGAGPSRPLCRFQYHAGRSEDLDAAIRRMDGGLAGHGLLLYGFSLGGNLLLKYLGEKGRGAPVLAAATVSAPIDLKAAQVRMMARRNRFYHDYMLRHMKEEIAGAGSELSPEERAALPRIRSIYEFDDRLTAPRNRFAGADDYYARCMARSFVMDIRVPTLVVQARNDPWVPFACYESVDWRANPRLATLFPRGGGHVGFHGLGAKAAWHDRRIAAFFQRLHA